MLLIPIILLFSISSILISTNAFSDKPIISSMIAGLTSALFVWGEVRADSGIRAMVVGPVAWWSENVIGGSILIGIPAVIFSFIGAYLVARFLRAYPIEGTNH
jgi:hypothetical protein